MRKVVRNFLVACLLCFSGSAYGQISDTQRGALGGLIYPITVEVGAVDPVLAPYTLSESQIQTDVELRLRKAGVPLKSKGEYLSYPQFYVTLNAWEDGGLYFYHIRIRLNEGVDLHRRPNRLTLATTWEDEVFGTIGQKNLRNLRENIADLVDKFINDYITANPKK
jgi:hypothetical protein